MSSPAPSTPAPAETPARRRVGRPRDLAKPGNILDAAWTLFLAHGVAAITMETIAATAHVSKGTLYGAYADKAALFEAVMRREMARIEAAQGVVRGAPSAAPLDVSLRAFGIGIMTFLASEPAVAFYNVLSAELRQHPDLARAFWDLGPGQTRANLTALLAGAAARGEIAIDDPLHAAEALFGLWQGFSNLQFALAQSPEDMAADVERRVAYGVDIFLRAHAPPAADRRP